MAKRKGGSRAVRSAAGRGATIRSSGVGPMQFGRSTIGWGASASPAARAMGAVYGALPRSTAYGLAAPGRQKSSNIGTSGAFRRILNPWGNNVPQASASPAAGVLGRSGLNQRVKPVGGRRMPIQSPDEIRIDYPANDPRRWPIAGGKTIIFDQAGKSNRHNLIVDRAFYRGGYALQQSVPTISGTDVAFSEVPYAPTTTGTYVGND